ncbi:MAG: hybrid sensor histidine kinase/response regulator [Acidiferrobacteraceae bacterium]
MRRLFQDHRDDLTLTVVGVINIVLGGVVIFGWYTHRWALVHLGPMLVPTSACEAFIIAATGVALIAGDFGARRVTAWIGRIIALVVIAALSARLLHYSFGIDRVLFGNVHPFGHYHQRMAPLTLGMTAILAAVLLSARFRWWRLVYGVFGAVLFGVALASVGGQLALLWPSWSVLSEVPLLTALAFLATGAALFQCGVKALRPHKYGSALLTMLVFMSVSIVLARSIQVYEAADLASDTRVMAQAVANEILAQPVGLSAVRRITAFWEKTGLPDRLQGETYGHLLQKDYPALHEIGWVTTGSRVAWRVSKVHSEIMEGWLRSHRLRLMRDGSGGAGPGTTISLISTAQGTKAFVVFVPVVQNGVLRGFIGAVFNPADWLRAVLGDSVASGFHVRVSSHGEPLYVRGHAARDVIHAGHRASMLGQPLEVRVAPEAATVARFRTGLPDVLLASGLAVSLLAALAVYAMQEARRRSIALSELNRTLEAAVEERTLRLRERTERLEEERERWRVTLLSIGDGVIVTDRFARVTLMNSEAEGLSGWTVAEAEGRPLPEILPLFQESTGAQLEGAVFTAAGEIRKFGGEALLKTRDGHERRLIVSSAFIRDRSGRTIGAVSVLRDVTRAKALEQEALKARGLESLGVLAGGIAHDFNNILTAIIGNLAFAKDYASNDPGVRTIVEEAERSAWRARELTVQLLTFAKGGAPIKKVGAIAGVIRDVCPFFLQGSKVRAEMEFPEDLWRVEFDPDQIGQVIQNLVINASEAMPDGGTLTITGHNVTLTERTPEGIGPGDYVEIRFADTGAGIDKAHLHRIFDPYFSLKKRGSGLGLAIAYSVLARHLGAITVESELGKGAVFSLFLPRSLQAAAPDEVAEQEAPPRGSGRLLLMEDDDSVRRAGAALLKSIGYTVAVAKNGEEAVAIYLQALANGEPFGAVILDLTVPGGMGGWECLQILRAHDPDIRAVVSSGYYIEPVMADVSKHGFSASVPKPFHVEDMARVLSAVMGQGSAGDVPKRKLRAR